MWKGCAHCSSEGDHNEENKRKQLNFIKHQAAIATVHMYMYLAGSVFSDTLRQSAIADVSGASCSSEDHNEEGKHLFNLSSTRTAVLLLQHV